MKAKQHLSIRLISMFLIVLIVISSLSIPTHAINYDQRTKVIKSAITNAKEIITQYPIEESTESFRYDKKTAYDNLNSTQKQIYKKLYKFIKAIKQPKLSKKYNTKDISKAFNALSKDDSIIEQYTSLSYAADRKTHKYTIPHITYYQFYTDGLHKYKINETTTRKERNKLRKEINQYTKKIDSYANMIVKGMPSGISTIDKYRYLAACLCYMTDYNKNASDNLDKKKIYPEDMRNVKNRNAWSYASAFVYGSAVCQGYARAYEYLCKKANLYCIEVNGDTTRGLHAWNLVKLPEGTYYIDVTWMDGNTPDSKEWYKFFIRTREEMKDTHKKTKGGITTTGTKSYYDICTEHFNSLINSLGSDEVTWSASKQNDITFYIYGFALNNFTSITPFKEGEVILESIDGSTPKYDYTKITIKGDCETLRNMLTSNGQKLKVKLKFEYNWYTEFTIIRGE